MSKLIANLVSLIEKRASVFVRAFWERKALTCPMIEPLDFGKFGIQKVELSWRKGTAWGVPLRGDPLPFLLLLSVPWLTWMNGFLCHALSPWWTPHSRKRAASLWSLKPVGETVKSIFPKKSFLEDFFTATEHWLGSHCGYNECVLLLLNVKCCEKENKLGWFSIGFLHVDMIIWFSKFEGKFL